MWFTKIVALLIFVFMFGVGIGFSAAAILSAAKCGDCMLDK